MEYLLKRFIYHHRTVDVLLIWGKVSMVESIQSSQLFYLQVRVRNYVMVSLSTHRRGKKNFITKTRWSEIGIYSHFHVNGNEN
jgi:hypothetical protein